MNKDEMQDTFTGGINEFPDSVNRLRYSEGDTGAEDILLGDKEDQPVQRPNFRETSKPLATVFDVTVFDVAEYILQRLGRMSTMKLQKLVYYCQAWSLVWDERPLFNEPIEAWANGPVVPKLFYFHRGMFDIEKISIGNPSLLSKEERSTINAVLDFYGKKSAQWLIDLSHDENPWQEARRGLPESSRGSRIISHESMANYYSSLRP